MEIEKPTLENWRDRLKRLGKEYFVIEEMIRLGFLNLSPDQLKTLQDGYEDIQAIGEELQKIRKELKGTEDITPLLKEIRKNRIERVRAKRALRNVEKAQALETHQKQVAATKQKTPFFLGKDVSAELQFEGENIEKLASLGLPLIKNVTDLAQISTIEPKHWLWLAYHRQTAAVDHYTRFQIPKKKGGFRSIASPKTTLRKAQSWISENILQKIPVHTSAAAFQEGKSIVDNAKLHLNKELVIRIDLKDFFPSIKFNRVRGIFKSLGYNPGMASIFALVCTDALRLGVSLEEKKYFVALGDRYLPQGACTSPMLTNIICRGLDNRLVKLAQKHEWAYTRYADDLVFSTANKTFDVKKLMWLVNKIIKDENFEVNSEKTMIMHPHQRQTVTGVLVNHDETKLSRRDMKNFRAFLHQLQLHGEAVMSQKLGKDAKQYAQGYLAFIKMVNPQQAEKFTDQYTFL